MKKSKFYNINNAKLFIWYIVMYKMGKFKQYFNEIIFLLINQTCFFFRHYEKERVAQHKSIEDMGYVSNMKWICQGSCWCVSAKLFPRVPM